LLELKLATTEILDVDLTVLVFKKAGFALVVTLHHLQNVLRFVEMDFSEEKKHVMMVLITGLDVILLAQEISLAIHVLNIQQKNQQSAARRTLNRPQDLNSVQTKQVSTLQQV